MKNSFPSEKNSLEPYQNDTFDEMLKKIFVHRPPICLYLCCLKMLPSGQWLSLSIFSEFDSTIWHAVCFDLCQIYCCKSARSFLGCPLKSKRIVVIWGKTADFHLASNAYRCGHVCTFAPRAVSREGAHVWSLRQRKIKCLCRST